mgnify:CR=1 FL=1
MTRKRVFWFQFLTSLRFEISNDLREPLVNTWYTATHEKHDQENRKNCTRLHFHLALAVVDSIIEKSKIRMALFEETDKWRYKVRGDASLFRIFLRTDFVSKPSKEKRFRHFSTSFIQIHSPTRIWALSNNSVLVGQDSECNSPNQRKKCRKVRYVSWETAVLRQRKGGGGTYN